MPSELVIFTFTIAAVSLTPGLCMTLAFTLGMTIGYGRSLWMMLGELSGVATVFAATFWSLGWLLEQSPMWFTTLSLLGGGYILYLSVMLFREPDAAIGMINALSNRPLELLALGYITAVSNPKGWAFLLALLPGFINIDMPRLTQFTWMLSIMMLTEFTSMSLYAGSGRWLARRLESSQRGLWVHRTAASFLALAAAWIIFNGLSS
jgi:threonine/homoserine/homoserine lactone efflux protein